MKDNRNERQGRVFFYWRKMGFKRPQIHSQNTVVRCVEQCMMSVGELFSWIMKAFVLRYVGCGLVAYVPLVVSVVQWGVLRCYVWYSLGRDRVNEAFAALLRLLLGFLSFDEVLIMVRTRFATHSMYGQNNHIVRKEIHRTKNKT
jgi:hypothetical protein